MNYRAVRSKSTDQKRRAKPDSYSDQKDAEEETEIEVGVLKKSANLFDPKQRKKVIDALKKEMSDYADRLEYEKAAAVRDEIQEIERTYNK